MISKVQSAVISGIEGQMIELETHIANGMPNHVIVGLPGQVVKESKERVKSALKVMGIRFPDTRITQNLYPAYLRKEGAHLDLPMAVGILTCMGRMNQADKRFGFIGELSLEGHIRPIKGALSLIEGMKHAGITHIVLPEGNLNEGRYVDSVSLYPFQTLEAMVAAFESDSLSPCTPENPSFESIIQAEHFRDVIGQEGAVRAAEIAAAGFHNILFSGPPGSGKTMIARRLIGILPPPDRDERVEIAKIKSAFEVQENFEYASNRPLRAPHHTLTRAGMIGSLLPGEVTRAHRGILLLDEMAEFRSDVLESLREPLSTGWVNLTRHHHAVRFPARFMLVGTMNPCPCGNYFSEDVACTCTTHAVKKYIGKLSGPMLDRFDLNIYIDRVETPRGARADGNLMRLRIESAHALRKEMEKAGTTMSYDPEVSDMADRYYEKGKFSMRRYKKLLALSETIALLDQRTRVQTSDFYEAYAFGGQNRLAEVK